MRTHPPNLPLRVLALVVVVATAVFNFGYGGDGDPSVRSISERYDNLFSPASYAFAIWGLIHLAFIAYAAIALLPGQSRIALHDRMAPPLIAANLLTSVWIVVFTHDRPVLSMAVMLLTLAAGIAMYRRVVAALRVGPQVRAWVVPFSLFLGWISVATIGNAAIALVAQGAEPKSLPWAIAMLAAAVMLGLFMALRFRDAVFPAVVGWASLALAVRGASSSHEFADAAIVGALVSFCASAAIVVLRAEQTFALGVPIREEPSFRGVVPSRA
jgi:benzodiazapine receptor